MNLLGIYLWSALVPFFWVLWSRAARPWYTWLHLAELPGAAAAYLAGPGYRRRLRAICRKRREEDLDLVTAEPLDPPPAPDRGLSLRSRALPGQRLCECTGCTAARARAQHDAVRPSRVPS